MIRVGQVEIIHPNTEQARAWAERLGREIEKYRIPAVVRKKSGIRRTSEIAEPWLIVLCAPETKADAEIAQKIDGFIRAGRYDHILTLLIAGAPEKSFPDALVYETLSDGQVIEHEPLAANITAPTPAESRRKLKVEMLRILAPMLGVSFDALRNRRHRQRVKLILAVGGAALAGALAFLIYAANRVQVISGQNKALNGQYAIAEEARQDAAEQKNAARDHLADNVALQIEHETRDNELVLMLCLEFLPENGREGELPALMKGALDRLCASGYAPVTRRAAYAEAHGIEEDEDDLRQDTDERPAKKVVLTLPEDTERFATDEFILGCWSEAYRYAVYNGGGDPNYYTWIRFLDEPERSYFMRDERGDYCNVWADACLDDGTFIGTHLVAEDGIHYDCYRYDPIHMKFVPFSANSPEPEDGAPLPEGRLSLFGENLGISDFVEIEGMPALLGELDEWGAGYRAFDRETLLPITDIEGANDVAEIPGTDLLLLCKGETFLICRKDPFEPVFETDAEYTDAQYTTACEIANYDGGALLVTRLPGERTGRAVYDLNTGKRLCVIAEPGMAYDMALTGDGRLLNSVGSTPTLWDLRTGEKLCQIQAIAKSPDPYGPVDEASGLRDSSAVNCDGDVYIFRDAAIPVPDDLEGQVALARQLLDGRELTDAERERYNLTKR